MIGRLCTNPTKQEAEAVQATEPTPGPERTSGKALLDSWGPLLSRACGMGE